MAVSKAELERRMRHFHDVCRAGGLRVTHQRTEVYREVAGTDEHPDAETIYGRVHARVPAISVDTVYRTLGLLEELGLVEKTSVPSGPARYDANVGRHHHFLCTECGAIRDFESVALDDLPIPRAARALGRVEGAQVQVRGVCAACMGRKPKGR